MSKSLTIECDPIDQPAVADPVERRTWCALRIRIAGRTVTRILDRELGEERAQLYVPAFPLAEWVVSNWWALLNEPCRTETPLGPSAARSDRPWIKRHCLRSAESGLLLPALYLYNDGHNIHAEWQADERDTLPNMPGEFVDSGFDHLEIGATEEVLSRFVSEVLGRLQGLNDARVDELKSRWQAVNDADAEEKKFCVAAGRMGVDPYDPAEMSDSLAAFLEQSLGDPDVPWVRDLTEVAASDSVARQWSWVQEVIRGLQLGPMKRPSPFQAPVAGPSPSHYGYKLAASMRHHAGLAPEKPLPSVEDLAQAVTGAPLHMELRNHVPGRGIRAVVGWAPSGVFVAGPVSKHSDNQRFLVARGLYHGLFSSTKSERLVTEAFTWDQQASRAFAAELLAPQRALLARTSEPVDRSRIEELANEFQASSIVIEKQLENAGVPVLED
jgi:hypothetical protein